MEHALTCQYLFAAFSMKRLHVEGGVTYRQLERMRQWEAALLRIARQEMEHQGLALNLRTAIGEAPTFDAAPFPYDETVEEIALHHALERFWRAGHDGLGTFDQARTWMDGITSLLQPYLNGHWYQNYPQRNMPDFRWRYWGDAFNSLLFVKHKYDPAGRFTYEQSISPYPDDPAITRSGAPTRWSDNAIADTGATPCFLK